MAYGRRSFMDLVRDADEQSRAADLDWRRDPPPAKYSVGRMGGLGGAERAAQRAAVPSSFTVNDSGARFFAPPTTPPPPEPPKPEGWGDW